MFKCRLNLERSNTQTHTIHIVCELSIDSTVLYCRIFANFLRIMYTAVLKDTLIAQRKNVILAHTNSHT